MARTSKKSVYERIESKKEEILNKEKELQQLNNELNELYAEQDNEEQIRLLAQMKSSGLDINKALELLAKSYETNKEDQKGKNKSKSLIVEEPLNETIADNTLEENE